MGSTRLIALTTLGLIFLLYRGAAAQVLYAGAGVGPTPVLDGRSGNRNWFGMIGYQGPRALGGRLSGSETVSRLWLSADLTYQPGAPVRVLRPYAFVGGGVVLDLSDTDPLLTVGAGLRARLERLIFMFVDVRLHAIPGSTNSGPSAILPITFGLGLGK